MRTEIERLLRDAERAFNDAARMHFDGKVNYQNGRISAFKEVLELLD